MACEYKRYMEETAIIQKTEEEVVVGTVIIQNTAIIVLIVGEFAAELRQYNYNSKLLQRFVRVSDCCLCLIFVSTVVLAHLLTPHIG